MAAAGNPLVIYHWFSTDFVGSMFVQHKKKHIILLKNNSDTSHDYCLSLASDSSIVSSRNFASASKTLNGLISRSAREYISGSLGLNIDTLENNFVDNCNSLLFNIVGFDGLQDNLLLFRPGKVNASKLFTVNNGYCDPDLKACSSYLCSSSLKFQVEQSTQQISLFDTCFYDNAGISFLPSKYLFKSDKGYDDSGRIKCPGFFPRGLGCDSRRPWDWLKELCLFGKQSKGQLFARFNVAGDVYDLKSMLNGISEGLEIISEKFKGRGVSNISNIPSQNDVKAESASEPLNIIPVNHLKKLIVSMNTLGRNFDKERTTGGLVSSHLLTQTRLHQCLKHLRQENVSSGASQNMSESCKLLQKYVPPSSCLGKDSDHDKLDHISIQKGLGPVNTQESLRRGTCSQKGIFHSPFSSNALAGALAGTFVSLWLHPLDTVKTVIQSRSVGHRSVFRNFGSIMSERGVAGLYRGIGSNLASSAPISGIYTFTYESVKAALVPHLSKEHHAFAHCIAGGCASIATSFIYTPTDCIKQQMQVGSQYSNSWKALTSILEKGGFPLLYAGWGAVLCRNVPQSVIKFYTYEGLKHLALRNRTEEKQLSALQTLAFGGLAGSTAALFTTPFDLIKTRLQTQIPGSPAYYEGVFQAFKHIAKHEGLGGLYRGLLPRLVIYISQGALFFASYEFFTRVLSIEIRRLAIQTSQSRGADNMNQSTIVEST